MKKMRKGKKEEKIIHVVTKGFSELTNGFILCDD